MSPGPTSTLGVLLAAGTGSRFEGAEGSDGTGRDSADADDNKLLADLEGVPVVVRAAQSLIAAREADVLGDLVVVLGHEADAVGAALSDVPFDVVENPDYAEGQATSVRRGAQVARERGADAVLFALGDMPCVTPATVTAVVDALEGSEANIAVPVQNGQRGNPVAFGAAHFAALASIDGDTGGRSLFDEGPVERVPVDDEGIHLDVDTVEDLAALRERCG